MVDEFYVCEVSQWLIGFETDLTELMTWVWLSWGDLCGWQDITTPITATTTVPTDKPDGFCGRKATDTDWNEKPPNGQSRREAQSCVSEGRLVTLRSRAVLGSPSGPTISLSRYHRYLWT